MLLSTDPHRLSARIERATGVPVDVFASDRTTAMRMRVNSRTGRIKLTAPSRMRADIIEGFVLKNAGWAKAALGKLSARVPFEAGSVIPVNGIERTILQDESRRFAARLVDADEGPGILVGRTEFPARHIETLLREEALRLMERLTREKASIIGRTVSSVSVKDTTSRWGSCTSTGNIAYSWRMILAPPDIADYLAAHEVAHLAEMNHSTRFWRVCASLSAIPPKRADGWLAANGRKLLRYG